MNRIESKFCHDVEENIGEHRRDEKNDRQIELCLLAVSGWRRMALRRGQVAFLIRLKIN